MPPVPVMRAYSVGLGQPLELIALETPTLLEQTGPSVGSGAVLRRLDRDWNASLSMCSKAIEGLPPRQTLAKSPVRAQSGEASMDSTDADLKRREKR